MSTNDRLIYPQLETPRIILKELTLEDAEFVYKHFSDSDVTQFMDIEPCKDINEGKEIIQFHLNDTGCRWGLFDRKTDSLLGTIGFHCWVQGDPSRAEMGFDLAKSYWGKGLMQEALQPVIQFGFEVMDLTMIEATVEQENVKSRNLMERLNFKREEELRDGLIYYYLMRPTVL
jgi:ribosomal-protein-alanine N-acetyltransferase